MFKLLNSPNIKLVYISNKGSLPDTEGTTHIARIISSFAENNETWYKINLLTDINGKEIKDNTNILIPQSRIIEPKIKDIKQRAMYVAADNLIAENFVIKNGETISVGDNEVVYDIKEGALIATSRNGLGSGIYGFYNKIPNAIRINTSNAYVIHDQPHGESITNASLMTNRYLDNIIISNKNISDLDQALQLIENYNIDYLTTLWNIVFYRTDQSISQEQLEDILADYLVKYYQNDLFDSETGQNIIELPINFIMINMGYTGIIADDLFNNSWDRGCVSYRYDQADKLVGNRAPY